ncbi:hypothetical protein GW796_10290 [archaeon]|nr:hypothetical protein [archaeon]
MDLIGSLFVFFSIAVVSYFYAKKKRLNDDENIVGDTNSSINKPLKVVKEELERRASIVSKVDKFIDGAKFVEPIATWRNNKIYNYIFNDGFLYKFEEILSENNQKLGIDEEFLCFKQFCYKRVSNPIEFMNKFGKELSVKI